MGPMLYARPLPRVAPQMCRPKIIFNPSVMFICANRSLLFGVTRLNNSHY
jgi:hypothetical protein